MADGAYRGYEYDIEASDGRPANYVVTLHGRIVAEGQRKRADQAIEAAKDAIDAHRRGGR